MKNKICLTVFMVISIQSIGQRKLIFRPNIGLAKKYNQPVQVSKSNTSDNLQVSFDSDGNPLDVWFPPQLGFMLEYQFYKKHTIGFGIGEVGVSHFFNLVEKDSFKSFGTSTIEYFAGKKIGVEYTYCLVFPDKNKAYNEITNKFNASFIFGVHWAKLSSGTYGNQPSYLAINGSVTTDSGVAINQLINQNNIIISPAFRIAYKNNRNIEKLSMTFMYDYGIKNMVLFQRDGYYENLSKSYQSSQIASGSQLKIYLSMPFTLFDFDKKNHILYN
jgi:hypothetical protein